MLLDDIIPIAEEHVKGLGDKLREAHSFVIASPLLDQTRNFCKDSSFLDELPNLMQLPYDLCFLEVTFPLPQAGHDKMGFLWQKTADYVFSFWPLTPRGPARESIEFDIRDLAKGIPTIARTDIDTDKSAPFEDEEIAKAAFLSLSMSAFFALLASPQILDVEKVDHKKWNKKRARRGQRPLSSYTRVNLKREIIAGLAQPDNTTDPSGLRIHWRRGHFKHRATGTYWWGPHIVGAGSEATDKLHDKIYKVRE